MLELYEKINKEWRMYLIEKLMNLNIPFILIKLNENFSNEFFINNPEIKNYFNIPSNQWDYYFYETINTHTNTYKKSNLKTQSLMILSYIPQYYTLKDVKNISLKNEVALSIASRSPKITCDDIFNNIHLPWKWDCVAMNPNLTFDVIYMNKDKFSCYYYLLVRNSFQLEKNIFFMKKYTEWFKKSTLKKELIEKLWHPKNYKKFKYYDPEMFDDEEYATDDEYKNE